MYISIYYSFLTSRSEYSFHEIPSSSKPLSQETELFSHAICPASCRGQSQWRTWCSSHRPMLWTEEAQRSFCKQEGHISPKVRRVRCHCGINLQDQESRDHITPWGAETAHQSSTALCNKHRGWFLGYTQLQKQETDFPWKSILPQRYWI